MLKKSVSQRQWNLGFCQHSLDLVRDRGAHPCWESQSPSLHVESSTEKTSRQKECQACVHVIRRRNIRPVSAGGQSFFGLSLRVPKPQAKGLRDPSYQFRAKGLASPRQAEKKRGPPDLKGKPMPARRPWAVEIESGSESRPLCLALATWVLAPYPALRPSEFKGQGPGELSRAPVIQSRTNLRSPKRRRCSVAFCSAKR